MTNELALQHNKKDYTLLPVSLGRGKSR